MDLRNKTIAVLGGGVEGVSSATFLAQKGAKVTVLDEKETLDAQTKELFAKQNILFIGGKKYADTLSVYDMIVRSPGVPLNLPGIEAAKQHGTVITSQTKLFFDLCPGRIIGVTGTKGKGTTSSLIYAMLKADGKDAYLGGNIGKAPFTFLDALTKDSWVVLELSSFQLEDAEKSPHIAVMLMVTSEHLAKDKWGTQNYHATLGDYVSAKRNILSHQTKDDFAILNRDYPATNESDTYTEGKVFFVSREREVDEGAFVKDNIVWLRRDGKDTKVLDCQDILLPGKHNLENVCSAVVAATLSGASLDTIRAVLQIFKGLEHRLELVADINGVKFYDDSFSTTPETAIAAIEAFDSPEILILGGSTKQSDFTELGRVIRTKSNIKAIIGIGVEWERIKQAIGQSGIDYIEGAKSMQEVVLQAKEVAQSGDIVLLSPACASFDMFKNYKERGEQFKKAALGQQ